MLVKTVEEVCGLRSKGGGESMDGGGGKERLRKESKGSRRE